MVLPELMSFLDWADNLQIEFPKGNIPRIDDENDWQDWAEALLQIDELDNYNIPTPFQFNDWREWAARFIEVIY